MSTADNRHVPGMRLKQRVKAGEITVEEAIALLKSKPHGEGSTTYQWLLKRRNA